MPWLLLEATENIVILSIELDLVLVEVVEQIICAQDLCNLHQLIRVTVAVEERLLAENHGRKHGSQTPHVEAVIVFLEVDQQLGALEITRGDADVVLRARVIELGQSPINQTQLQRSAGRRYDEASGRDALFGSHGRS